MGLGYVRQNVHSLNQLTRQPLSGPIILTTGPWRPVYLEAYASRIDDLRISSIVDESLAAKIDITLALSSDVSAKATVVFKDPVGKVVKNTDIKVSNGKGSTKLEVAAGEMELWWPVNYGKQTLHTVEVQVADEVSLNTRSG